jgi:GDPmannose 4,6-dehydratase
MIQGDLTDPHSLRRAIESVKPDEIYNLGAQSFVARSWVDPYVTTQINAIGTLNLLECIRDVNPDIFFYQASTSEMFGNSPPPQNEDTKFHPRSPYGVAKLYAHYITVNYRESYGIRASCGILFNHESPLRGEHFVTQKVCTAAARGEPVVLGNLEARRDWGFAGDYVTAMQLMLQRDPDDYVIATGKTHSVEELVEVAYGYVGLNWQDYVTIDSKFIRPAEVHDLCGDPTKAKEKLGWEPETSFYDLVKMMVNAKG